jgi:ATP/maltotriose-dependent transcriptional regulator MalT/DNA-binding SARP family transcriptional activator
MPKPSLAKLTRPRLHGVLARERLIRLLDQQRPAVWIMGPPGAGKTMLIASYLGARELPGIWYQLDAGDFDPATFFYYLGLAAQKAAPRSRKPLPLFTPEYFADLPGFTRRFFRELYSRLPQPAAVVFDNCQDAAHGKVHALMREALTELADGITLIAISRNEPPPELSRFVAARTLNIVGWEDLRLTLDEALSLAQAHGSGTDAQVVQRLHQRCDGWAAGLTLMLERTRRSGASPESLEVETREAAFDYFAGEIFDGAEPVHQQILIATAFLPRMTARLAEQATGNPDAGKLLEELYRRHWFTDRRSGREPTYQYHDLFRQFLLNRARAIYTPLGLAQLSGRAARLLAEDGQVEDAIALYCEAGKWQEATDLILQQASALLAQGRGETVREWIARVPEELVSTVPWLRYWLGTSLIASDQAQARHVLESAYHEFKGGGDLLGQASAVWGIAESVHLEWSDSHAMDRWIDVIEELLNQPIPFSTTDAELRAYASAVTAFMRRKAESPLLLVYTERLHALVERDAHGNAKVSAASMLLNYYVFCADFPAGARLVALIHPVLGHAEVSPLSRALWLGRVALFNIMQGMYAEGLRTTAEALAIAEEHGLIGHQAFLYYMRHLALLHQNDVREIQRNLARFEAAADQKRPLEMHAVAMGRLHLELRNGHADRAVAFGETAVQAADQGGFAAMQARSRVGLAVALTECGRHAQAQERIAQARALVANTPYRLMEHEFSMVLAYSHSLLGDVQRCRELLAKVFQSARTTGRINLGFLSRQLRAHLFTEALRAGIEPAMVRTLIRQFAVDPGATADETWPWRFRVMTLGELVVHKDENLLVTRGKGKLLEMLKLITAAGGAPLAATAAGATLWPDVDGDVAAKNLDTTLFRLRKLLGADDVVRLQDGKLSLDPRQVWVDAWAFERLAHAVRELQGDALIAHAQSALRLYRAHFLEHEADQPWVLPVRERLKAAALELVKSAGRALEDKCAWAEATRLYQQAIAIDSLAEPAYRRLMLCYREQGEDAEALNVYRRCRSTLSIVLGIQPSPETQALYVSLRQ